MSEIMSTALVSIVIFAIGTLAAISYYRFRGDNGVYQLH